MAYAFVHEFEVGADRSTTNYDAIDEKLGIASNPPEGMIVHSAGFAGDKFRMVDIWETPQDFERFQSERLIPTVFDVVGQDGSAPTTQSYELHNLIAL
jgi:hypothetical protein